MKQLELIINPKVNAVFDNYPEHVKPKMLVLRYLIIQTAQEMEEVTSLEETLKWGEPSYLSKTGSTIRIDWKPNTPNKYAMYFKCTSRLVPTFKEVFKNTFEYEGNRAIVFELHTTIINKELKECIKAALRYHKVKHLPFLGIL
ncbi:MAG: DUF1801 domain-containing protein [Saprospiraceae bacterium]